MKKKRLISLLALLLLLMVPAGAVLNEKDLAHTLSVLRFELRQKVARDESNRSRILQRSRAQHTQMVDILKNSNELALVLYSQNQDYTFDITYALKAVTRQYEDFNKERRPFDQIMERLDAEIESYSRLIESLRRLPPELKTVEGLPDSLAYHNDSLKVASIPEAQMTIVDSLNAYGHMHAFFLDEAGQEDRDSCIRYATNLLLMYQEAKDGIIADNEHYEDALGRLKESYDYAQERYFNLQRRMFFQSQGGYFRILRSPGIYISRAWDDAVNKYSRRTSEGMRLRGSEWRGPIVTLFMLLVLLCLGVAFFLGRVVVSVLQKKVKAFQTEDFPRRRFCVSLLVGSVIFAIAVSLTMIFVPNHFFQAASDLLMTLAWLLAAIFLSMVIRLKPEHINPGLKLYLPLIALGIIEVSVRILFVPNSMMNMLFPLLLLAVFFWQLNTCRKQSSKADRSDNTISWITLVLIAVATILSWAGFTFLSLVVMIWWLFQVAAIETLYAIGTIIKKYRDAHIAAKVPNSDSKSVRQKIEAGEYIANTWHFDFIDKALVPILATLSLPLCIVLALDVFDLTEIRRVLFYTPFFDFHDKEGNVILHLSFYKIVLTACLYFLFRYISYAAKAFYKKLRLDNLRIKNGKRHIHTNEVNLALADNVIEILVWGVFIITCIIMLKIPTGALSIVAAGLATGVGLAMKDILNNFIYGIQLMSGRLRVGDWLECDGIRGKVSAISYQSTQIELPDGAVMSFLNASLFNKNFKNLTMNSSYEFVKIVVGVSYGTDIDKVRTILQEALVPLQTKDTFGRDVVDLKRGVTVAFDDFADSSVNIAVRQFVLVPERMGYINKAKEIIYETLNANGITIPFPQRDVRIVSTE